MSAAQVDSASFEKKTAAPSSFDSSAHLFLWDKL